ncbi:uncharacterized protein LOC126747442 [Anthonomus grandis grandis]|uniref:uncharacterized protein LOC126747442 n=1 Tax=Anthonomus grandis grandis TaxID=2921223 RepID=UPI0021667D12|nr:uncharacterized protein LOC126747442 [Anthonomus grandis grandis]
MVFSVCRLTLEMPPTDRRLLGAFVRLTLILGSFLVPGCFGIRCYVCDEEGETEACSAFRIGDPKFVRECGDGFRSCRLSQKADDATVLSRSCETIRLHDCKMANSVEFCYCTTDLCNSFNLDIRPEDDEIDPVGETLEGSGKEPEESTTTTKPEDNTDIAIVDEENAVVGSRSSRVLVSWPILALMLQYVYIQ